MDQTRLETEFTHVQRQRGDQDDVAFYVDRAQQVDGPVLELGCGTGRVYLELLRAGVDADGIDRSTAALSFLRETATEAGLEPTVWQDDMTELATSRSYDLVICPFNTVQELLAFDDRMSMFEAVDEVLASGGEFVFDVFVPNFEYICATYGEWQSATVTFRGETHEYRTRARLVDEVHQVAEVEEAVTGPVVEFTDSHRMTLLPHDELTALARLSPFDEWTVTGDFTDEPIEDGHTSQVWALS